MSIISRIRSGWNAFTSREELKEQYSYSAASSSFGGRPDRSRLYIANDRSIVSSLYNRMAVDVSEVELRHVRVDSNGNYLEDMSSGLHDCLTVEANIDQAARQFRQDIVMTLFDQGVAAIVPVDTDLNPETTGGYDIKTLRVGRITAWYPDKVRVDLYNERTGLREEITLPKRFVAIVENPLYTVMNEPNSTLQRLVRKLSLLDSIEEQAGSGKLDLIIQLPYTIKSEALKDRAEQRRVDIEMQLKGSKYGIAYTDGTERITQLNRPAENNLLKTVEYLTTTLYGQLGITPEIMNGGANESAQLSYRNRTIEPIMDAIAEAMARTFLTKTARTQGQAIRFFVSPFKLVPVGNLAEIADKFTRNEILSSNEFRGILGYRPSSDPKADELRNSNMPQPPSEPASVAPTPTSSNVFDEAMKNVDVDVAELLEILGDDKSTTFDNSMKDINSALDAVFEKLGVEE